LHVLIVAGLHVDIDEDLRVRLVGEERLEARPGEVVVTGGEEEGATVEPGPGEPDAAQDAVVLVERVQHTGGPGGAGGAHAPGVEPDHHERFGDPSIFEVIEDVVEDGPATQIEQHLVAALAEILEARAAPRCRDESFHPLLFSAPTGPCETGRLVADGSVSST